MNREIKFRGKSMGNHWVYGLLTKKKIRNSGRIDFAIATDDYSLAVILFELLTTGHPYVGDIVINGTPEMQTQAYLGLFPYIDDPDAEITFGYCTEFIVLLEKEYDEAVALLRELRAQCVD